MKKILLSLGALAAVMIALPMFSAFEAHVINVTARIENALSVPVEPIKFGTVFPQEQLDRFLPIGMSRSFFDEPNADDINYVIRQKPKCGVTSQNGEVLDGPTWTGHVVPTKDDPTTLDVDESNDETAYTIDCVTDKPADLVVGTGQTAGLLPMLCSYLSKHEMTSDPNANEVDNDGSLAAFHQPFTVVGGQVVWNDVKGRLAKSENDTQDNWKIDLKVPCFGGFCAQDWAKFVYDINPDVNANDYTQLIANEHKVFGCNLWVEVTGVSRRQ